jgi:putative SOS response-associated peptidase YedK
MRAMCGRYANFSSAAQKAAHFDYPDWPEDAAAHARYNIAPGAPVEALRMRGGAHAQAARHVDLLHWGLVPYWAKDKSIAYKTINARSETAHASPAFRSAFTVRRCLIVADGYYEWQRTPSGKQPYFIRMADGGVFAFGGLWERWRAHGGADAGDGAYHHSCTILTTDANTLTRGIHDRMPLIVHPRDYAAWLAPEVKSLDDIRAMIAPFEPDAMLAYPVGARVNNARIDDAQLIERAHGAGAQGALAI